MPRLKGRQNGDPGGKTPAALERRRSPVPMAQRRRHQAPVAEHRMRGAMRLPIGVSQIGLPDQVRSKRCPGLGRGPGHHRDRRQHIVVDHRFHRLTTIRATGPGPNLSDTCATSISIAPETMSALCIAAV